jgi:hypothetical protein
MKLVETSITMAELRSMAVSRFGDLVKAVVDIRRNVMAVDADLHSDEEALLLQNGSAQVDLWGVNLYHIRPSQGNRSRGVDDPGIRARIVDVVSSLVRE